MKKILWGSLVVILVVLGITVGVRRENKKSFGSSSNGYALQIVKSGNVSLPSGTSTIVSLPDTARAFGYLCNTDKVSNETLGFSQFTPTATSSAAAFGYATSTAGVVIFPQTCFTINQQNNFWGQINATTASSGTTTLLYMFGE